MSAHLPLYEVHLPGHLAQMAKEREKMIEEKASKVPKHRAAAKKKEETEEEIKVQEKQTPAAAAGKSTAPILVKTAGAK